MKQLLSIIFLITIINSYLIGQCSISGFETFPTCSVVCDNEVTVNTSGAVPPLYYQWNDPDASITQTVTGLCPGNYTCTVTDSNDCVAIGSIFFADTINFSINVTATDPSCPTCDDGSANVLVTGDYGSFQFLWDDFHTTAYIWYLTCGTHYVDVWDCYGCHLRDSIILCGVSTNQNADSFEIDVIPNPTNNFININTNDNKTFDLIIYDNIGKVHINKTKIKGNQKIDVQSFENGVYHIVIVEERKTYREKIIINK